LRCSICAARAKLTRISLCSIRATPASSHQLYPQLTPNDFGGALKAVDGGAAVVGIEQPIHLRAAGLHQRRHALLGDLFLFHFVGELVRDHGLDRGGGDLLADALLVQPAFEARADVRILFRHDCTRSKRLRQTGLTQNCVCGVAARDADWYRKVSPRYRAVPDFMAALALTDQDASGGTE
jgi:hypothetical protein